MMDWIPVIESGSRLAGLFILAVMPSLTRHVVRCVTGPATPPARARGYTTIPPGTDDSCHIPVVWRVRVVRWTRTSTAQFEANRPRLQSVAYRMLGSLTEAEDAVQETWIRLSRSDAESIDNLGGWLTTVLSRVCLGILRSRRSHPEEPLEPEEPEPELAGPEDEAILADTMGPALLVVLETLTPAERLVVRAPRHVRGAIRGHRADRRSLSGRRPPTGQPGPAARPGQRRGALRRSAPPA